MSNLIYAYMSCFQRTYYFCHWNVNSVLWSNSIELSLIEACNSIHDFDLIALFKTHLDSSISSADKSLKGFSPHIFRGDHPSNANLHGAGQKRRLGIAFTRTGQRYS